MKKRLIAAVLCCLMVLLCACEKGTASSDPKVTSRGVQQYKEMIQSMKDAVPKENVLMADDGNTVPGSNYLRRNITGIFFRNSLKKIPKDSWDVSQDGSGKVKAWVVSGNDTLELYIAGEGGVRAPENCYGLFAGYENVTQILFEGCFDTSGAADMRDMFRDCRSLAGELDLSIFRTGAVTDMSGMFAGTQSLESIVLAGFDTSSVTAMAEMFRGCGCETLDLSTFQTGSVTDMRGMFEESAVSSLTLQSWDTGKVTDMSGMFRGCTRLKTLDLSGLNTAAVQTMAGMFENSGITGIDLKHFNTGKVTDLSYLFAGCEGVTKLDLRGLETQNVQTMASMFRGCSNLTQVDVTSFDTSSVTDMSGMFFLCYELKTPDFSKFDVSGVEEYDEFMVPGAKIGDQPWEAMFTTRHHLTFN